MPVYPKVKGKIARRAKSTGMYWKKHGATGKKNVSSATSGDCRIRVACVRVLYHGRVCAEPEGNCKKNRSAVKQHLQLERYGVALARIIKRQGKCGLDVDTERKKYYTCMKLAECWARSKGWTYQKVWRVLTRQGEICVRIIIDDGIA